MIDRTITFDAGGGVRIELRRSFGEFEFRPVHSDNPLTVAAVQANVELRAQWGAWAPVPDHLLDDARREWRKATGEEHE